MVESIKKVLMSEGYTEDQAERRLRRARADFMECLSNGKICSDFCEEEFGLEPDYLEELMGL